MNHKLDNINKFLNVFRSPLKILGLVSIVLLLAGIVTAWTYTNPPEARCFDNGTCVNGNTKWNETTFIAESLYATSNVTARYYNTTDGRELQNGGCDAAYCIRYNLTDGTTIEAVNGSNQRVDYRGTAASVFNGVYANSNITVYIREGLYDNLYEIPHNPRVVTVGAGQSANFSKPGTDGRVREFSASGGTILRCLNRTSVLFNATTVYWEGVDISGLTVDSCGYGIKMGTGYNNRIHDNTFIWTNYSIYGGDVQTHSGTGTLAGEMYVYNNRIFGVNQTYSSIGIYFGQYQPDGYIYNNILTELQRGVQVKASGNNIYGNHPYLGLNGECGICAESASNIINGNYIDYSDVNLSGGTNTFTGNFLTNPGKVDVYDSSNILSSNNFWAITETGFRIHSGDRQIISGNEIVTDASTTGTIIGIEFRNTGNTGGNIIKDNNFIRRNGGTFIGIDFNLSGGAFFWLSLIKDNTFTGKNATALITAFANTSNVRTTMVGNYTDITKIEGNRLYWYENNFGLPGEHLGAVPMTGSVRVSATAANQLLVNSSRTDPPNLCQSTAAGDNWVYANNGTAGC